LVSSLLTAIVRADGDALVMHVGEQPYVVAPAGPVELSSRPLTLEAVAGMLGQLLPADSRRALDELGAIEHELPRVPEGDRFTVVAARGGDDIWLEIRRHRAVLPSLHVVAEAPPAPEAPRADVVPVAAVPTPAPVEVAVPVVASEPVRVEAEVPPAVVPAPAPVEAEAATASEPVPFGPAVPTAEVEPAAVLAAEPIEAPAAEIGAPEEEVEIPLSEVDLAAELAASPQGASVAEVVPPVEAEVPVEEPPAPAPVPVQVVAEPPAAVPPAPVTEHRPAYVDYPAAASGPASLVMEHTDQIERALERLAAASERSAAPERQAPPVPEPIPAVVLPLARNPVRPDTPTRAVQPPRMAGIDRLLRLAAARGANTLYVTSQGRPSVRVDGEIAALEGEPVLTAAEVESLLVDLAPERNREALRNGEGTEWMSDVPEVGRVRCQSFRDHRGPGGIFRMIATRPTTAEQLGLSREIQSLCAEPEGLILVAGPRSSGKSTLISAFVDLINRARTDYLVTVETQITCVHDSRGCLVSQREARGDSEETANVLRAALRENPDIIVIEDLRSPEVVRQALDAMDSGHLVIGAVAAHTSTMAIGRILEQFPPERRAQAQVMLAEGLRGVVSQVLLHKTGGGRIAARELLLNTPSIASLIAEGRLSQLPVALDSGRKHGMVPLNDALAAFVQSGIVDVKDAYRKAYERQAFLAVLRREGVDTSFVERLA
jgi:twitching motility protein PilT